MNHTMVMRRVTVALERYAFRYATEEQLHRGIVEVLEKEGLPFEHEKTVGENRYDFMLEAGVVLEVKMARSASQALRQIDRYVQATECSAVICVTTKPWKLHAQTTDERGSRVAGGVIEELRGKPVRYVQVRGQSF